MRHAIVLLFVLAVSGCATNAQMVDRTVGAGQPLQYKSGYSAGCDSGNVAAGHPYYRFKKDVASYAGDNLYRQGWDDGFTVCKGQYDTIMRSLR